MTKLFVRQETRLARLVRRTCDVFNIPQPDRDGSRQRPFVRLQHALDCTPQSDGKLTVLVEPGIYDENVTINPNIVDLRVIGNRTTDTLFAWSTALTGLSLVAGREAVLRARRGAPAIKIQSGSGKVSIESCYILGDTEFEEGS